MLTIIEYFTLAVYKKLHGESVTFCNPVIKFNSIDRQVKITLFK
jgi:hypothetical protein